jgi:predicted O-methyltransferase YrrM
MAAEFRAEDWKQYKMEFKDPHRILEPAEKEIAIVGEALNALQQADILSHTRYDQPKFLAHRQGLRDNFEVPWTAITPRQQRLIYAVNAIAQPQNLIAAGCFCGFTFFSNAGAAVGPGACYTATNLLGVEIKPEEAARAERNVRKLDATGVARVVAEDAVETVRNFKEAINLLYLDADGDKVRGKGIYLEILQTALERMPDGSLVLAHNSVNCAERLKAYLEYVRDPKRFHASVNVILDDQGLEVTRK